MTEATKRVVDAAKDWAAMPRKSFEHITEVKLHEALAALEAEQRAIKDYKPWSQDEGKNGPPEMFTFAGDAELEAEQPTTHCGHPVDQIVSGDEGTAYCKQCEAEQRVTPQDFTSFDSTVIVNGQQVSLADAKKIFCGFVASSPQAGRRGSTMDKIWMKLAYLVPRKLAYWCAIRVNTHATVGKYSTQIVPALTAMDALKRWEEAAEMGITPTVEQGKLSWDAIRKVNSMGEDR